MTGLVRVEDQGHADEAIRTLWPDVPATGTVALLAMPVGPQGELGPRATPLWLIEAAARRLGHAGAQVRVVCVPGRLDEGRAFAEQVIALEARGVQVAADPDFRDVVMGGHHLARAAVLEAVVGADHLAVLAPSVPHRHLTLGGPLLALADTLEPDARGALWAASGDPRTLTAMLHELASALAPRWSMAWLGEDLSALCGGVDLGAVEDVVRQCHGLDGSVTPVGLAPSLVRREIASARTALPNPPDRFPGVDAGLCTRCGTCTTLCPTGAVTLGDRDEARAVDFDYDACLRCGVCVDACPDFALTASVRADVARPKQPQGLVLQAGALTGAHETAVSGAAALAVGAAAADPPPRRPTWLEGFEAPDRFQVARARARCPEPEMPRVSLSLDGATRLVIAPNWGARDNRTSLGVASLAGSLRAAGRSVHVIDLARQLRQYDPALVEALEVVGEPDPNGGYYGPRMPLVLQVTDPEAWGDDCPMMARRVHESAGRDADRVTDPSALHGLTVADSNVTYAFALGAAIRARGGRVVLGGPSMSHAPTAEIALRAGVADAVVMGEGEGALLTLDEAHRAGTWDALDPSGVPGLQRLVDGAVSSTPNRRNRALDALPLPDWDGQLLPLDYTPVLAARGCVTKCSFCSEQTISPKFAQRSVDSVVSEMDAQHRSTGQRCFEFNDDLLNGNVAWLESFCAALSARGAPYGWQGLCRPHGMTRELLRTMRDAGCEQITYGVQHFSDAMLTRMGRRERPDPLRRVLDDTLEQGIEAFIDIIVGHPGETEEDFEVTRQVVGDLMSRYPNVRINLNPFNLIYGSDVMLRPEVHGVTLRHFDQGLPASFEHLQALAERFVVGGSFEPSADTVVDRVNRLAWSVFRARAPAKIPILDEELPFCNDNCLHCGVADIMTTANVVDFGRIARSLHTLAPRSGGQVMFAVSELTIRPDFMKILKAARRAGMKTVALVTNGRMFSYPDFARRSVEAGMTHALVSVYGPTARTHQAITRTPESFEQTIAGLRALLTFPALTVMTNSVITKKNYRYLPQLVELLSGLGVQNINLSFVQIIGNAARYQRALVPRIKDVLPYLKDAVDLGVGQGRNMGIGGLPYCVLKGYEHHFGVDDLTIIANSDPEDNITERSPYAQAESCRRCAYNAVCLGVQDEYLRQYGEEDLDPYHGRRLDRRPDSEIVRAMFPDMQFTHRGHPSSLLSPLTAEPAVPGSGGR
ncbi:MAG: radical SAM protein [Myxococcota bacterium]|nr:radical SAM protein [Myxococcota bacterium]